MTTAKLGVFVTAGLAFLVLTLYMIGKNRNLFGSTFTIYARLENVNGLLPGNNVRYRGVDVGTVKNIGVADDTSILVSITLKKKFQPYIKQNSIASIGTDGLMGNKLVNINAPLTPAPAVQENSVLMAINPVETDEMLRTLDATNKSIAVITRNLEQITYKLNRSNSLWALLGDSTIARDLKLTVTQVRVASKEIADFGQKSDEIISNLQDGSGVAGALLTDDSLRFRLNRSIRNIEKASAGLSTATTNVKGLIDDIQHGKGMTAQLISDTTTSLHVRELILNLKEGSGKFSENMEAMKHNFLFRRYFRKKEKAAASK